MNPDSERQISHWNCIQSDPNLPPSRFLAHPVRQRPQKWFLSTPQERGEKTGFFEWFNVSVGQKLAEILTVKVLFFLVT